MDSPADALARGIESLRSDLGACVNEIDTTQVHLSQLLNRRGDLNAQLDEWAAALVLVASASA